MGGKSELESNRQIVSRIAKQSPNARIIDLTCKTSLLDLVALFERVDLVVGPDTGPLHLAAAVGKPKVIGIYGSTPTGRLESYGTHSRSVSLGLWCQPCYAKICPLNTIDCLRRLTAETVLRSITDLWYS